MHLSLGLMAIAIAWCVRVYGMNSAGTWADRWRRTLGVFLFSPLLLLMTALAVLRMGTEGQMLGLPVGWFGYLLALGLLGFAGGMVLWLAAQGWRSQHQLQTYPLISVGGTFRRVLQTPALFAAQIGFWQPELVVSQGLLTTLCPEQLEAVLTHEQAHYYYRDTFWFFWLGWVRQLAAWLPNTEVLWQELLLLRELRADQWAAQRVDPLLLAESLLLVVQAPLLHPENHCAAFSAVAPVNRLTERVEALITDPQPPQHSGITHLVWLLLAFVPLLTVMLHT